jgi:hypothetical protein
VSIGGDHESGRDFPGYLRCGDIVAVLAHADVEDKATLYAELGVSFSYHPDGPVQVETRPRGVGVRVGGATRTVTRRGCPELEYLIMWAPQSGSVRCPR